jgi:beta-glucosidase
MGRSKSSINKYFMKKNFLKSGGLIFSFLACAFSLHAQVRPFEARIDSLLRVMTLEEKVGQMNQYNGFWDITGPVPTVGDAALKYANLEKGLVGSMLNIRGAGQVRKMQALALSGSRLGIPLIFGMDVVHGYKTMFPIPLAEAASWDLEAIGQSARVAAVEASAAGINWTFAPMVDISRDPRWGRVMEGAGEDPYLGSKIAAARVKGFQGDDIAAHNTVATSVKHFAGYGFSEAGKDYNTVDVGTSTLYNIILPPFHAAVKAGARTVMNSFNTLNGIPATANALLQRDILKGAWGFEGFVVSDWSSGLEMINHGYARDLKHVAELAANAGSDMDMESYAYITHLKACVEEGKVGMGVIDDAVRRILRVKFELGLFDDPYRYCNEERENALLYHPDHQAAALDMAKKSIVLLKNTANLLPLSKNASKIALIGALAEDKNSPLGNWRGAADDYSAVSVLEGVRKYIPGVRYAKGAEVALGTTEFIRKVAINETDKSGFAEAIKAAKSAEVVIMVLGEHGLQSGEGRSRANLDLPGVQQELLEAVYKVNKNIVLVLMNGRPLAITWAQEHIPAIVEAWHLGSQSGNAIAQVLFGDYNPSGKLPMTFPRSIGQIPLYYNAFSTGRPGPQELVFWAHYNDEANAPLYPFGYGLSYTTFEYTDLAINPKGQGDFEVQVTVKNTGPRAGEEVVQLYIQDKVANIVRPVRELKGFKKIALEPGGTRQVKFEVGEEALGYFDNAGKFVVEPGEFEVMVGGNSQQGLKGKLVLMAPPKN